MKFSRRSQWYDFLPRGSFCKKLVHIHTQSKPSSETWAYIYRLVEWYIFPQKHDLVQYIDNRKNKEKHVFLRSK
jgi:hypothetical protein